MDSPDFSLKGVLDQPYDDDPLSELNMLFNRLEMMNGKASTEGLGNIVKRITALLADYLYKVMSNINANVIGMFKSIKRSELEAFIASNKMSMRILRDAQYSKIYKAKGPTLPFTKDPATVGNFLDDVLKSYNMKKRLADITKNYNSFSSAVKLNDISKGSGILDTIHGLNMPEVVSGNISSIKEMVMVKLPRKLSAFGDAFDSIDDLDKSIGIALKSADEFNSAVKTTGMLNDLYKSLDKVHRTLSKVDTSKIDILKLKRVVNDIRDTGSLIESYGVIVKEAHHLEHWLVGTIDSAIARAKTKI